MRIFGNPARIAQGARGGHVAVSGLSGYAQRKGWRGIFALGFLFVMAATGYGVVFVLIDKWFKGGTLGIL